MFTRVCVDVDDHGNQVGWSWERRTEDRAVAIHVGSLGGPFDTPYEVFDHALLHALDRFGVQMRLFD